MKSIKLLWSMRLTTVFTVLWSKIIFHRKLFFWFQMFTFFLNKRSKNKQLWILTVNVNCYVSKMRRLVWVILTARWLNKTVLISLFIILNFHSLKNLSTANNFVLSKLSSLAKIYQLITLLRARQRKYLISTFELFIFTRFCLLRFA